MKNFKEIYESYKNDFEKDLITYVENLPSANAKLKQAVEYSVKAGGKRIRPVLMLLTAEVLGVDRKEIINYAISLELIHTYSLIHDDLPSMDNDDYRRGKLTNHKVFGEANAILAGDALLNYAYELMFRSVNGIYGLNASRIISNYAGASGMIGGQATDINVEDYEKTEQTLKNIHLNKTGKLITASVVVPSCFTGDKYFKELKTYGENLGILFQITDDILDYTASFNKLGKTPKKDENENKLTYVTLFGLEKAKEMCKTVYENTVKAIETVENSEVLVEFAKYVYSREF